MSFQVADKTATSLDGVARGPAWLTAAISPRRGAAAPELTEGSIYRRSGPEPLVEAAADRARQGARMSAGERR